MIKHIVMYRFPKDTSCERIDPIFALLDAVSVQIPGMKAYSHGEARGHMPLSRGFSHCFVMDFDGPDSLRQYLNHENHLAVRKKVREIINENDIFEFDYNY